eukprot:365325-Chlamydomonas_euryale.AAC.8
MASARQCHTSNLLGLLKLCCFTNTIPHIYLNPPHVSKCGPMRPSANACGPMRRMRPDAAPCRSGCHTLIVYPVNRAGNAVLAVSSPLQIYLL